MSVNGLTQHTLDHQAEIVQNFRMCFMRGCTGRGEWSPLLSISPDGLQYAHIRFEHWLMCEHHKDNIGLEDLIDGPLNSGKSGWETIQGALAKAGKDIPEREYTKLRWELA